MNYRQVQKQYNLEDYGSVNDDNRIAHEAEAEAEHKQFIIDKQKAIAAYELCSNRIVDLAQQCQVVYDMRREDGWHVDFEQFTCIAMLQRYELQFGRVARHYYSSIGDGCI